MNLKIKFLLLVAPAFAIFCYPIINSGYYGDDSLNSFIGSIMAEKDLGLFGQYLVNFKTFLPTRLSILHFYHWVFLIFTDLIIYKIYICAILSSALFSTYLVIKAFVRNSTLPALAVIFIFLIGIQFREYGDSVLVFHGATSISLVLLNLSILLFIRFLQTQRKPLVASALILFTLSCISYELIYPFFIVYFFIALIIGKRKLRQAINYLYLFLTPVVLLTSLNVLLRLSVNANEYQDFHKSYEFGLNFGAILLTFAKELIASLPLSNLILNPFTSFKIANIFLNETWILFLLLVAILFTVVFYCALTSVTKQRPSSDAADSKTRQVLLAIYALMLFVIPNAIIALSPKYQSEIIWGSGYVSLYFGYFGIGILISQALYGLLVRFGSRGLLFSISIVLGTAAAANFAANNKTVEVLNAFWKNPRTVAEESLRHGIMAGIENRAAYIFINNNYPWDITSFIHKYSGKFLNQEQYTGAEGRFLGDKRGIGGGLPGIGSAFSPKARDALSKYLKSEAGGNYYFDMHRDKGVYYFDYYADSDTSGYAVLADVKNAYVSDAYFNGLASDHIKIYLRMPEQRGAYSMMSATYRTLDPVTLKAINVVTLQENQFNVVSQGVGWKLIEIDSDTSKYLIDVKSLRINTSQKIYQTSFFPTSFLNTRDLKFEIDTADKILHVGFSTPFENSQIAFEPLKLGAEFSIVLRARLSDNVVLAPYAHIVGNHPGKNNFEGFVIQRKATGDSAFDLSFGNGKEWKHVLDFTLTSTKNTFIAVSVKNGRAIAVVDKTISSVDLGGNIQDSAMPLYLGNYVGKDRPFPGQVSELLITRRALPEEVLSRFRDTAGVNR